MKRVLAVMSINPDYVQFAIPELKSVLYHLPIPLKVLFQQQLTIQPEHDYQITHQTLKNFPYVTITVPDFQKHRQFFQKACRQTVMLNKLVLVIAKGNTYQDLIKNRDQDILKQSCRNWQDTVACDFISRNRVLGRTYQLQKINKLLGDLDVRGKIQIQKASKRFQLIEDHNWYQQHHQSPVDSTLKIVFFGLQLCNNRIGKVKFNTVFQLSKRIYLGPTSADNDLAFMMCNQGKITSGSFVLDPFVGTGGLIIPPASKGAYVFGCDLDMRVLNGYSVGRINKKSPFYTQDKKLQVFTPKIILNFQQYGFNTPNIFRMDSTQLAFKQQQFLDAIITDPPYGLRAMSRSVKGTNKQQISAIQQDQHKQKEQHNKEREQKQELQKQKQNQEKQEQKHPQSQEEQGISNNKQKSKTNCGQQQNGEPAKIIQSTNNQQFIQNQSNQLPIEQLKLENQTQKQQLKNRQQQNLSEEQQKLRMKKLQKRQIKKQNRLVKKSLMTQQEKQFKKNITERLNRQRIDQWDKFDKGKVQCTQRQKIFQRLINFAKTNLKQGGRLVFLYPIYEGQQYKRVESLPEHKGFKVIDMSENKLSKNNSRILVTLQKEFK